MIHFYIILFGIVLTTILSTTLGVNVLHFSLGEVMRCVLISFAVLFVVNLICAILVRLLLPKKLANPFSKFFKVHNWERKFYEKLGVRAWKDRIAEAGKIFAKFDKSKISNMNDGEYLYKFMQETIYGELIHWFSFVLGFVVFFVNKQMWHIVGLPMFIINTLVNILPYIVQRYNRPRLMAAYMRLQRNNG